MVSLKIYYMVRLPVYGLYMTLYAYQGDSVASGGLDVEDNSLQYSGDSESFQISNSSSFQGNSRSTVS